MGFAGYDNWKLRSDLDEFPPQEEPPVESDELEIVHQELADLKAAVLGCLSAEFEEDAELDEGRWVDRSTVLLTFSMRRFEDLVDALGIRVGAKLNDLQAFKSAAQLK